MEAFIFYSLASVMVISSLMVILRKNPVHSALFLILTFFCLAGIFLQLNAQFIAAVQVIVYAGAIMVLFLFVIMLLDPFSAGILQDKKKSLAFFAPLLATLLLVLLYPFLVAVTLSRAEPAGR